MSRRGGGEPAGAVQVLARSGFERADAVVTLGSGHLSPWREKTDLVIPYAELPGWPAPGVPGHHGNLGLVRAGGMNLLVMEGRHHYYEARSYEGVDFPLRVAGALGARLAVLTNSAGSLRSDLRPGDIVLTAGHLFLQGALPPGSDSRVGGARSDAWWEEGRASMVVSARREGVEVCEGVLACVSGPNYETGAEAAMLRNLGADVVSMSLVPEALAAASMGMKTVGLSIVTNTRLPVAGAATDHEEVMAAAARVQPRLDALLGATVPALIGLQRQGSA